MFAFGTAFKLIFCFLLATSGSDSPGQAVEAEEIVKQLDMEQLEETPTSTTTDSSRDLTFDPALNPRPLLPTDAAEEEGEIVTEADMPPLTGEKCKKDKSPSLNKNNAISG